MKRMKAKYQGKCAATGVRIVVGDPIIYFGRARGCWSIFEVQKKAEGFSNQIRTMVEEIISGEHENYTLEESHGETYHRSGEWNLYAHGTYERGSCLAGQPRRTFIDTVGNENDAEALEKEAPNWLPLTKYGAGSTSHISVDLMTQHLSDEPDTGW